MSMKGFRMNANRIVATAALGFLFAASAIAQPKVPALYALHTAPQSGCPGLDWHVTWGPDNSLVGVVGWDRMTHMARLAGTIQGNGSFSMNAEEIGGTHRKAVVTGTASGDYIKIIINGSGTACDGEILNVPRAGTGMGGGGAG
jgi:hypothetical protein